MLNHAAQALTVSAVAKFLASIISQNISSLWIKGEVSNLKIQQNGNVYLNIKDEESKLNAIVMNTSRASKKTLDLKNGMEILVFGRLSYYKKEGTVSLFIDDIELLGEGLLKQKFDALKKKLEAEGFFSPNRKRKIPSYPRWVGVVTSPSGAAIQDILNVTNRRFGSVNIVVFPAAVQGENAADEISRAIMVANRFASDAIDVLIVGRGGGSVEDLWCFNEEIVARAIFNSKIPVISAVGHEIDYTIADYVADLRAPTPSAAAEIVVKDRKDVLRQIEHLKSRCERLFQNQLDTARQSLEQLGQARLKLHLGSMLTENRLTLDNLNVRFQNNMKSGFDKIKADILRHREKLAALNPANILKRGFSISYLINEDGVKTALTSVNKVHSNDKIETVLTDGAIISEVI